MRASLVRIRSRLKSQVHAICADAGVPVSVTDLFGRQGREQLALLELRPVVASRLAANLRLIDEIGREILTADRELQALFRGDDRVRRLMPIPGIGFLTAVTIIAEVGDAARFGSADRLASWAGLTPTEHSSADHTRRGHITKQGSRWLRWTMVEAAATDRPRPPRSTGSPTRSSTPRQQDREGRPRPPAADPRLLRPPRLRRAAGRTRRSTDPPVPSRRARQESWPHADGRWFD